MNNDLISRAALFEAWDSLDETQDANLLIDAMIKETQDAPAVDAEPVRHGEWTEPYKYDIWDCYVCSRCKFLIDNKYIYCPNCGAKMTRRS